MPSAKSDASMVRFLSILMRPCVSRSVASFALNAISLIARLRRVISDTAEMIMSLPPALTFLVSSGRSSTSTERSRTP